MQPKPCQVCGEEFESYREESKYCSQACYRRSPKRARSGQCETCGKTFHPRRPTAKYCSRPCYGESLKGVTRVEEVKTYRMKTVKGHPIAPPSGVVAQSRIVLWDKIGPGPHPCSRCGMSVDWRPGNPYEPDALVVDHLDWDTTNDQPSNLVPCCNPCNAHRRKKDGGKGGRIRPGEPTVLMGGKPTRAVVRECGQCGHTFLIAPAKLKQGRGKYCPKGCGTVSSVPTA